MPEQLRSIINRLRVFVGNRRRAPRYRTHLEAGLALSVSLPSAKPGTKGAGQTLRLAGYTRDISESGLALIVPAIRIGGQYITGENRALRITLKLPNGIVELEARPVRYSPLEEEEEMMDTGYLIGVQITAMSDDARARYKAYIEGM